MSTPTTGTEGVRQIQDTLRDFLRRQRVALGGSNRAFARRVNATDRTIRSLGANNPGKRLSLSALFRIVYCLGYAVEIKVVKRK